MTICRTCDSPLPEGGRQKLYCSHKCAMKYHNSRQKWSERPDRQKRVDAKREAYRADPEAARQRMRKWRADNPDRQKEIERRHRKKNAASIAATNKRWREENADHVRAEGKRWHEANREAANEGRRMRGQDARQETPWRRLIMLASYRAKKKSLAFALTDKWARSVWTGRCAVTGMPFAMNNRFGQLMSPSLDRIDPKKGYVPDNCRFILFSVNAFKGTGTDQDMLLIARQLLQNYQEAPVRLYA